MHARENDFDSLANGGYLDAINTYTAKSYTPSSQGAILSLSFGESVIGGPYIGPCLLQDGTFYFGPGSWLPSLITHKGHTSISNKTTFSH